MKAANFFMFQFHLLEHEIYFFKNKFEFCFEVGKIMLFLLLEGVH